MGQGAGDLEDMGGMGMAEDGPGCMGLGTWCLGAHCHSRWWVGSDRVGGIRAEEREGRGAHQARGLGYAQNWAPISATALAPIVARALLHRTAAHRSAPYLAKQPLFNTLLFPPLPLTRRLALPGLRTFVAFLSSSTTSTHHPLRFRLS